MSPGSGSKRAPQSDRPRVDSAIVITDTEQGWPFRTLSLPDGNGLHDYP